MLEAGLDYETIGRRLGISPGLVYLIATGLPADGSDAPSATDHDRPGFLETSQQLSNPESADNPTSSGDVHAWIKGRVLADEQMRAAAAARDEQEG
jgi:hypothetical protein